MDRGGLTLRLWTSLVTLVLTALVVGSAFAAAPGEAPVAPASGTDDALVEAPGDASVAPTPTPTTGETPGATAVSVSEAAPAPAPGDERAKMLSISVLGRLGVVDHERGASVPVGGAALLRGVDVGAGFEVGGSFGFRSYRAAYTSRGPVLQGAVTFDEAEPREQFLDAKLNVSYNVLATVTDALWLRVGVAPRFVQLVAKGFDSWLFAPEVEVSIGAQLGARVAIDAGFGFSAAVAGPSSTPSVDGLPKYLYDVGAGVVVDLTGDGLVSLELRYEGSVLVHEYVQHVYHGAQAGLRIAL